MANVRIISDATAHLDPKVVERYQVTVLPMTIHFGNEQFPIALGDDSKWLFRRMAEGPAKPSRASISVHTFEESYEQVSRETEEILVILSSSKLSNACRQAQAAVSGFLGRCRITVLDSMTTSWGLGLIVEAAAKAASEGQPLDDIVRLVRGMLPHVYLIFLIERLDYLERGGRLGVAQALLGTLLRIKPLLLMESGEIIALEKVRTRLMALEKLVDFVTEFATLQQAVILRSPLENGLEDELVGDLQQLLVEALPNREFPVIEYGPLLASHLGPEALGIFVYEGL
ncbi:MAG: DegV family protein [Anaerolineae bacterium]|jgi:DegV family protein with EDD domain